ncbi:unnamed protein product [Lota lota]
MASLTRPSVWPAPPGGHGLNCIGQIRVGVIRASRVICEERVRSHRFTHRRFASVEQLCLPHSSGSRMDTLKGLKIKAWMPPRQPYPQCSSKFTLPHALFVQTLPPAADFTLNRRTTAHPSPGTHPLPQHTAMSPKDMTDAEEEGATPRPRPPKSRVTSEAPIHRDKLRRDL